MGKKTKKEEHVMQSKLHSDSNINQSSSNAFIRKIKVEGSLAEELIPVFSNKEKKDIFEFITFNKKYAQLYIEQTISELEILPVLSDAIKQIIQDRVTLDYRNKLLNELLDDAISNNNWQPFVENLIQQGVSYMQSGIKIKELYEIVAITKKHIMPLIQKEFSEPKKIISVIEGMSLLFDNAMAIIGESYFSETSKKITANEMEHFDLDKEIQNLKEIIENNLDPLVVIGHDGKITYVNKGSIEMFGIPREKLIGTVFFNYFTEPVNAEKAYQEAIVKGLLKNCQLSVKHVSGKNIDVLYNLLADMDESGKVRKVYALARDVTELKENQININQSNEFIDSVIENIPNMVYVKEVKELRYIRFNKAAEKILGFSKAEVIGKNDYDIFPKEQADFFIKKDREAIRERELQNIPEEYIFTKSGNRWLHTKKITITDEKNNPVYLLGISEDITDRKKLEREIAEVEKETVRLEELEKFRKLTVGRELKMIELKKEIEELKSKLQNNRKSKKSE